MNFFQNLSFDFSSFLTRDTLNTVIQIAIYILAGFLIIRIIIFILKREIIIYMIMLDGTRHIRITSPGGFRN